MIANIFILVQATHDLKRKQKSAIAFKTIGKYFTVVITKATAFSGTLLSKYSGNKLARQLSPV